MNGIFDLIDKAKKSDARNYGDVKISEFDCGCKILTLVETEYFVFKEICNDHKKEYEEKAGKGLVDKLIMKDDQSGN